MVVQLAQDFSISPRQAYRYLEQAQGLREPLPPSEVKLAFTVKLPHSLVQRVRTFAAAKGLSIGEVVSRVLLALLPRGRGRGPLARGEGRTITQESMRELAEDVKRRGRARLANKQPTSR